MPLLSRNVAGLLLLFCLLWGKSGAQSYERWFEAGSEALQAGKKDSAEWYFGRAAEQALTAKKWEKYLDAAAEEAGAVFLQLRYAEAVDRLQKLRQEGEGHLEPEHWIWWKAHFFLGQAYIYLGEPVKAEAHLARARELLEPKQEDFPADFARVLQKSGVHYLYGGGDAFKATDLLEEALALQLGAGEEDEGMLATTYQFLGQAHYHNYEFERAALSLQKALLLREKVFGPDSYYAASSHDKLGNCFYHLGQYAKALLHYQKAYTFFERDPSGQGRSLYGTPNNIANVYLALEDYEQALSWYQKALNINEALFDKNPAYLWASYLNLAIAQQKRENYDQARIWYQKALRYSQSSLGEFSVESAQVFQELASFYEEQGYFLASQEAIESSIRILEGGPGESRRLEQLQSPETTHLLIESYLFWGKLLREEYGRSQDAAFLEQAVEKLTLAVELLEHANTLTSSLEDRLFLNQNREDLFAEGIAAAADWEVLHPGEGSKLSFRFFERSRANVLLRSVSRSRATYLAQVPEVLLHREDSLKALYYRDRLIAEAWEGDSLMQDSLIELQQKISRYEIALRDLEKNIGEKFPGFLRLAEEDSLIRVEQLQESLLPPEGIWIEFFRHRHTLAVLKLTPEGRSLRLCHLPSNFDSLFNAYLGMLRNPRLGRKDLPTFSQIGKKLYDLLLGPELQSDNLEGVRQIHLVPDGKLAFLPFEALVCSSGTAPISSFSDVDFLLKKCEIAYHSSATLLSKIKAFPKTEGKREILALAWSEEGKEENYRNQLSPLPGTFTEVSHLRDQFQGRFLFGSESSEQVFKEYAGDFGVLHLAIHGKAEGQKEPALFFRSEKDSLEDGILYLSELYALRIPAELTVLSACESGLGRLEQREGVMNLARGFQIAGCRSVIQTLWELEDQSSHLIIDRLYQDLDLGKRKSAALRNAKLYYLSEASEQRKAPFFWASFVFSGDETPLLIQEAPGGLIGFWLILVGTIVLLVLGIALVFKLKRQKREK